MAVGKEIKSRIKSVKNTRKITKAMELVSASKMRRAVNNTLRARQFALSSREAVQYIVGELGDAVAHPLLQAKPQAKKNLFIVLSSDRGLAAGLNINVAKFAVATIKERGGIEQAHVIAIGKRAADILARLNVQIVAQFPALSNNPAFADILPIAKLAIDGFVEGTYASVTVISTDYVSGITQTPTAKQLLPVVSEKYLDNSDLPHAYPPLLEPSPQAILEAMLPRLVETTLYQTLLEATASEHAARMMAMKNASDAAKDMIQHLSFTYNQARQASITQEIAEISSGKAALE
jgi:F-type H+-transporting ATPase subunit gamma